MNDTAYNELFALADLIKSIPVVPRRVYVGRARYERLLVAASNTLGEPYLKSIDRINAVEVIVVDLDPEFLRFEPPYETETADIHVDFSKYKL